MVNKIKAKFILTLFFSIVLSSLAFAGFCFANFNFSYDKNISAYAEESLSVNNGENLNNNLVDDKITMSYWNSSVSVQNVDVTSPSQEAISSAEDLAEMMKQINSGKHIASGKIFYLTNDIDLSGKIWTPISNFNNNAVFDGCGYKIIGLNINETISNNNIGLFGQIVDGATVKNLILESTSIIVNDNDNVGGIAGYINSGKIVNCGVTGVVESSTATCVGGIVGKADASSVIESCFSYATVTSTIDSTEVKMGGIVGGAYSGTTISKCFYYGISTLSSSNSAGVVGYGNGINVSNVYTNGQKISGNQISFSNAYTGIPSFAPNNNWAKDSSGIMHGISGYVLKGVGNVTVTYNTGVYVFNIMSQKGAGTLNYSSLNNEIFETVTVTRYGESVVDPAIDKDKQYSSSMQKNVNNYTSNSTIKISSGNSTLLNVSDNVYTFIFSTKIASDYRITTNRIGQAKQVTINLKKYTKPNKSSQGSLNGEVTSSISLSVGGLYINESLNFNVSSSFSFYAPYGATYSISFENNGNSYLQSINAILFNDITIKNSSSLTDAICSYTPSTEITTAVAHTYLFDNTQTVTLNINDSSFNGLSGISPAFKIGGSTVSNKSLSLKVLTYERLSSGGFVYNNVLYTKFSSNNSILYPVWAKYIASDIKTVSGTSILSAENNTYGGDLSLTSNKWIASRNETDKLTLNVIWKSLTESVSIENPSKISNYVSEINGSTDLTKTIPTATNEGEDIVVKVKPGYLMTNFYLRVGNNISTTISITTGTQNYSYKSDTIDGRTIYGSVNISYEADGSYVLSFKHLIGVEKIGFEFDTKSYNINFKTNIDSSIQSYNYSPIKIDGSDINSRVLYSLDYDFKSTRIFNFEIKQGYSFAGLNLSDVKAFRSDGSEISLTISPFKIENGTNSFTLTLENVTIEIASFQIVLNIQKNSTTFNFELLGISKDFISAQYMPNLNFYGKKNDIVYNGADKSNAISVVANTDDVVRLYLSGLPNWIKIKNIIIDNFNGINNQNLNASDGNIITLSQYHYDDGTKISIKIELELQNSQINIVEEIQARQTQQTRNENLKNNYTYGTRISIKKDSNSLVLEVQDYNDTTKFERDVFFTNDANTPVREIKIYLNDIEICSVNINNFSNENVNIQKSLSGDEIENGIRIRIVKIYKSANLNIYNAFAKNGASNVSRIETSNGYTVNGKKYSEIYFGENLSMTGDAISGYKLLGYYFSPVDLNNNFSFDRLTLKTNNDDILANEIFPENVFVYAIYEAKIFTVNFQKDFYDSVINKDIITEISHTNTITIEYNTNVIVGGDFPIVNNCGMYVFNGWSINDYIYISYNGSSWSEIPTFNESWNFDDETNVVTLTTKVVAKTVNYSMYNDNQLVGIGTVTYGDVNYSNKITNITKWGYKFDGWQYLDNGIVYIDKNGVGTIFDIQSENVVFYAKWVEDEIELNFVTKVGEFSQSHKTSISVNVVYKSNKYISNELFDENGQIKDMPVWIVDGITFEFAYFVLEGDSNAKVYSANDLRNYTYQTTQTTFVAVYTIIDITREVEIENDIDNWTYDATNHYLSLALNNEYASYTFQWQKKDNSGVFQDIIGANSSTFGVKNVADSGIYRCVINATAKNIYAIGTINNVASDEMEVTINKKVLTFTQDGVQTNNITKVFDNTTKTPTNVSFTGIVGGENVVMTATYSQVDVGENISMNVTISSTDSNVITNNYTYDSVVGTITKYLITYNVDGEIFQVGDVKKQITIKEEFYSYNTQTQQFLQRYGFSPSIELYTSKNEVGSYEYENQNGYSILARNFVVVNGKQNFEFSVAGTFVIKDSSYGISVNILAKSNDLVADSIVDETISSITVNPEFNSISDNNTNDVALVESKEYFAQNPAISIKVNFDNPYYWIEYWVVKIDGVVVANLFEAQDEIVYNVVNLTAKQIEISVYLTTLVEITFDYNLVVGETLDNMITSTEFAYQQKVQYSIDTYGAVLPTPTRIGWIFTGWVINNTTVTVDTVWSYKDSTLRASWEIAPLQVEIQNDVLSFTYDGLEHSKSINLLNKNEVSLTYTYTWSTTSTVKGSYNDATLTVKDVLQSGVYSLRITASYNGVAKSILCTINVTITPFSVFTSNTTINKEYDTTNIATFTSYDGANGEKVDVFGEYKGTDAGSLINVEDTSVWYLKVYYNDVLLNTSSNYKIEFDNIDKLSQILKRNVTINIGYSSKIYDGTKLSYIGSYSEVTPFNYIVSTNDVECKLYSGSDLEIEISGDKISNFDITIEGSMEIIRKSIQFPIEWTGELTLTFDGQYHSVLPKLESDIVITGIRYYSENTDVTYSVENNIGVKYVGTYTITVTLQENDHYDNIQDLTTTLTIRQKTIYVSYADGESEYTKVYDGNVQILKPLNLVAWEKLDATLLSSIIPEESDLPTFNYIFENAIACKDGQTKNIIVSLDENNPINNNYILSQGVVKGVIERRQTDIYVNATKEYDGTNIFVVNAKNGDTVQITGSNIVDGEEISGNIEFRNITQVGVYTNLLDIEKTISLQIGTSNYDTNYEINILNTNINEVPNNKLEIIKAQVFVGTISNEEYVYTGEEVKLNYAISRVDGNVNASVPTVLTIEYTIMSGQQGIIESNGKVVQVGGYVFTYSLLDSDNESFEIVNANDKVGFFVVKRDLVLKFEKSIDYQLGGVVYSKADYPNDNIIAPGYSLGVGDEIDWRFITNGNESKVYYLVNGDEDFEEISVTISKGTYNYTRNYNVIYDLTASVIISRKTVDISNVKISTSTVEYNGTVQTISIYVTNGLTSTTLTFGDTTNGRIYNVKRQNDAGNMDIISPSDVKYAGVYTFDFEFNSFSIKNYKQLTFTITPRMVIGYVENTDKVYDGTNVVLNEDGSNVYAKYRMNNETLMTGFLDGDDISIIAKYDDKNVGSNKKITLELQSSNPLLLCSYQIDSSNTSNYVGKISQKEITFALNNVYYSYYTNKLVAIDIENFNIISTVANEVFIGQIVINKTQVGSYNLANLASSDDVVFSLACYTFAMEPSNISNYSFNYKSLSGTLVIKQAEVVVAISDTAKIYNGEEQEPTFEYSIFESRGEILDVNFDVNIKYFLGDVNPSQSGDTPINVGQYSIYISVPNNSNYILVNEDGDAINGFTSSVKFNILKRQIAVNVQNKITYVQDGNKATYKVLRTDVLDPNGDGSNGLLDIHNFSATLNTNSNKIGTYSVVNLASSSASLTTNPIYVTNVSIVENGTNLDVMMNYEITTYTATILIVGELQSIDTSSIDNLVYSATNKVEDEDFKVIFVFNDEQYEITYNQSIDFGNSNQDDVKEFTATLNGLSVYSQIADGEFDFVATNEAIDVGTYKMTLQIINNFDNSSVMSSEELQFVISSKEITSVNATLNKYYDRTSDVIGEITSSDIFAVDLQSVTITGVYVKDGNPTAEVGVHTIKFVLSGEKSYNYVLNLPEQIGQIMKLGVTLVLKDTYETYYTEKDIQIDIINFKATSTIDGSEIDDFVSRLSGYIVIDALQSNTYQLHELFSQNKVTSNILDSTSLLNNYAISNYSGQIIVNPCEISVEITNAETVYNGKEQAIRYNVSVYNGHGEISDSVKNDLITVLYDNEEAQKVNAGEYEITIKIKDEYSQNYVLINNENKVSQFVAEQKFVINKRNITIGLQEPYSKMFTGSVVEYNLSANNVFDDGSANSGLINGQTVSGKFVTNNSTVGQYTFEESSSLKIVFDIDNFNIFALSEDVTSNYNIVDVFGTIIITAENEGEVDSEHLQSLVYSSKDYLKSNDIFVNVYINGEFVTFMYGVENDYGVLESLKYNQTSASSVINAGNYTVQLTSNKADIFQSQEISFTVAKKQISNISFTADKVYDQTSSVVGSITSLDICYNELGVIDDVEFSGVYVDSGVPVMNVGTHQIVFTIFGTSAQNYELKLNELSGTIYAKQVNLKLKDNLVLYYTGKDITVVKDNLNAFDENDDVIDEFLNRVNGNVIISIYNTGGYNLEDYSNNITISFTNAEGNEGFLENYLIVGLSGLLTINKAQIKVDVYNCDKVYNGMSQYPSFDVAISNGNGEILEENKAKVLSVVYNLKDSQQMLTSPVNAGVYQVNISIDENFANNYQLVNDSNVVCDNYTSSSTLNINKRQINIVANPNPQPYVFNNSEKAVYEIKNTDVVGINSDGLVASHTISGTFTTNSGLSGVYELANVDYDSDFSEYDITPSIKILSDGTDVTSNYDIGTVTIRMVITSELGNEFDTSKLNNLVYDSTDKIASGQIQVGLLINGKLQMFTYGEESNIATFSELKFNNTSTQTVVDAGEYSFKILIQTGDNAKEQVITFIVSKQIISYVNLTKDKVYDGTSNIVGQITSDQIYSGDDVSFVGNYQSSGSFVSNVGKYEIAIQMQGLDISNYELQIPSMTGQITARNITIQIKDGTEYVYSATNPIVEADDLQITSGELVENQSLSGNIEFLQTSVGTYTFEITMLSLDEFKILDINSNNVISNYNITYSGEIKIVAVEITVTINGDLNFVYNGEQVDINNYITFENIPTNLQEEAFKNIVIEYNATPINAGNYTATIYSNSINFSIAINGQSDNVIDFVIQKRDIEINIGDIEVYYNPESDYKTNLSNSQVINIVENQNISGTYSLKEVGLDVGRYEIDEILFSDVKILVNGIDIINTNYNITAYKGSITVLAYVIEDGELYLENDSFVYSGNDVFNFLSVVFVDTNDVSQKITASDSTWGEISISESEAKNVGTYTVNVEIYNCELPQSSFNFEITPKEITTIVFNNDKEYNGDSLVLNQDNNTSLYSSDIIFGDNVVINGFYVDESGNKTANVGSHTIIFEIQNYDQYPQKNYIINYTSFGQITKTSLELSVDGVQIVYSSLGQYTVDNTKVLVTSGSLKTGDELSGSIYVSKPNYIGLINFSEFNNSQLKIVNSLNNDVTSNYSITYVGNVEIIKAQISISFDDILNEYIYNNQQVSILPNIQLINSSEEILPEVNSNYTSTTYNSSTAPKNVGDYTVTFTIENNCYEIVGDNSFNFAIKPYDLILQTGDIPNNIFFKIYGEDDPRVLSYVITSIYNENINIEFTREQGENVGTYDIYVDVWDNSNYNVTFASGANADLFTIKKASTLVVTITNNQHNIDVLSKIYDSKAISDVDISTLEYTANGIEVTGYLQFANGVNVGQYPLASWNLQSDSHEEFVVLCEINYTIKQKEIKLVADNTTKPYDASTSFIGNIVIYDNNDNILDTSIYKLVASGKYESANVGDNIPIVVTYQGDDIANYNVTNSLTGSIEKRNVTITPTSGQFVVYGTQDFVINYQIQDDETTTFFGNLQNEIEGSLAINYLNEKTKYVAGTYKIVSNLTSLNLNLNFVDNVDFVIEQKELTITNSQGFIKTYDGNANVVGDFTIDGLVGDDEVTITGVYYNKDLSSIDSSVGADKVIVFTLTGNDAENYFANNVIGAITDKMVTVLYNYIPDTIDMINADRLQNNSQTEAKLMYGKKVSDSTMLPVPKHEGYTFIGWFFDENFTNEITNDTPIDSSTWNVDEETKTIYAKWEIKTFDVLVVLATEINGIFVTDSDVQGGDFVNNISGKYAYYDVVDLSNVVSANDGYEFIGYSFDINLKPDENLLANGLRVEAQDYVVYAKFQPVMVTIILNANGGNFEVCDNWEFNSTNTTATLQIQFNSSLNGLATLPIAQRSGYYQDTKYWIDENDSLVLFDTNTIIGEDFYPTKTLRVNWLANEYRLVLDANGGYFEGFNTKIWHIDEQDEFNNAIKVSKSVVYGEAIGELIVPVKNGWTFNSWSISDLSADYIWQETQNATATAVWGENQFNLTINSQYGYVNINVYDGNGSLIENVNTSISGETQVVVSVKNTYSVDITLTEKVGYLFTSWSSDIIDVNNSTEKSITLNTFTNNQQITANFDPKDNKITIKVNDDKKGYLSYKTYSTNGSGMSEFLAKTGSSIELVATANEGYEIASWSIDSGDYSYEISNTDIDSIRTLSNFVSDVTVVVNFGEKTNSIKIISDIEKGTISVENEIDGVSSYVMKVKTDSFAKFTITAKQGYKVNTDKLYWSFETTSSNKGNFDITGDEYVCVVTFTGFSSDGTIVVPFEMEEYTVNVISVLRDDNLNIDLTVNGIVTISDGQSSTTLNSNQSFRGLFKTTFTLTPNNVIDGYEFKLWSVSGTKEQLLTSSDGLVNQFDNGIIEFNILKNTTLYLIYSIKSFEIQYEVNDFSKGSLSYDNATNYSHFSRNVKYGYDDIAITAVSEEQYRFVKWVQEIDGEQVDYSSSSTITVTNVTQNAKYIAIFEGIPIELTVNLTLPESETFDDIDVDFGEIVLNETNNTVIKEFVRTERTLTYIISTITGENIEFSIVGKNGYEFDIIENIDPRLDYTASNSNVIINKTLSSSTIDILMKAQINEVVFRIVGDLQGADVYEYSNKNKGIVKTEYVEDGKAFKIYVKTGGNAYGIVYTYNGYKIIADSYFETPNVVQDNNQITSYAVGGLDNVRTGTEIIVRIEALTYKVTFNYNYENAPENVESIVEFGKSNFNPMLDSSVTNAERYQYNLIGWNTRIDGSGLNYQFDSNGIYSIEYVDGVAYKRYGFLGGENNVQSSSNEYDFDSVLYASWELQRFRVNLIFVPNFSINTSQMAYQDIFPEIDGRYIVYSDYATQTIEGVSYVPGYNVRIVAPSGYSGFNYYGWSFEDNITDRALLNQGEYNAVMGEEDLTIYLYYTMDITVSVIGGGVATASKQNALYGESVYLQATSDVGYSFKYWIKNGTSIDDSQPTMEQVITQPTLFQVKFIGDIVNVILEQTDNVKLGIKSSTSEESGVYRVGDIIVFEIYDLTYGYYRNGWLGEYSGGILNDTYTILPQDSPRGYVKFKLDIQPSTIFIQYLVDGGVGGTFVIDESETINTTKSYDYDSTITFVLKTVQRYELTSLSINGVNIDLKTTSLNLNSSNGIIVGKTNILKATFSQLLWIDNWEMFSGVGTENDPYVITSEKQLAAMAYLINNNVDAKGKIPYAKGYYIVKKHMNLQERFWQPIGTKENPFDGTFNLQDYVVSELLLDKEYEVINLDGLFGYITDNAKFITTPGDYTVAITIVSSIVGFILLLITIIVIIIVVKKKKFRELSNATFVNQNADINKKQE